MKNHLQDFGRNMDVKGDSGETPSGNQAMLLDDGKKITLVKTQFCFFNKR